MAIKVGSPAPSFTLVSSEREEIALESYKGQNVVLLFFPFAFTSTCTEELCMMRDNISVYEQLDAKILAISVDSPFTLAKFKAEHKLNFPVLSDFNKEVSTAYDTIYQDFVLGLKGVSKRSSFVIDKEGIIKHMEVLDNAGELPSFEAVKETLSSLN